MTTVSERTTTAGRRGERTLGLPSGRAVVGSALVVIAAAGVLAAHRSASAPPSTRVVVVTRDVPAGTVVGAADLGTVAVDLPAGTTAIAGDDAHDLVGTVARHDLDEMDILRPSDTGAPDAVPAPGAVVVPVQVDRDRSLQGVVHAGSRVDVLATDPDGGGTRLLAADVLVQAVDEHDDGLGPDDGIGFRLALADGDAAASVVDASVRSQLTIVLPDPTATTGTGNG